MTCGERIATLRKEKGYPQEYLAQQIGVSRQAVHKWEKDISTPDTSNLIALAQVLNTTVDYIVNGSLPNADTPVRKKLPKIWTYVLVVIITAVITFFGTILFIANRPVSFDAGACGGGFAAAVYNQYSARLIEDNYFYLTRDFNDSGLKITDISPLGESKDISYEGKAIYMSFDVIYTFSDRNTYTARLRFVGDRKWIQKYEWRMINEPA